MPTGREVGRYRVGAVGLAAEVRGEGPALLLLHGFPLDRTMWRHQVVALTRWRRIAPDLRGAGASDAPESGYCMAAYADDVAGLLDRLGVARAVVAGLSMGGYVAFELWRRHRDRIMGLVLVDTRSDADGGDARRGRDELAAVARAEGPAGVAERMLPRLLGRSTRRTQPALVEQVREMVGRSSVPGIVGALGAMRDRPDSTALLPAIDVPVLVVVGEEDEVTPPAVARSMVAAVPSAVMATIPGAGHLSPLEAPATVNRVLEQFLETIPGA